MNPGRLLVSRVIGPRRVEFKPPLPTPILLPAVSAVVLLLLPAASLEAQIAGRAEQAPPEGHGFVFTHWTTADGLPQNSVNDILETTDGRLWLATFGGLVRFDGGTFDVLDVSLLPELRSNQVMSIAEAAEGGIWAVTMTGQMLRIESDEVVERIMLPNRLGPLHDALRIGPDGELLIASRTALHRYSEGAWRTLAWQEGLPGIINAIDVDDGGRVWLATEEGLVWLDGNRFTRAEVDPSVQSPGVASLYADRRSRVWLGTPDGLAVYDPQLERVVPARLQGFDQASGRVTAVAGGREDELWIGSRTGLVHLHLDSTGSTVHAMFSHPSLDGREVSEIIRDWNGSTWVGTRGAGLVRLAPRRLWHVTEREGLPSREVNHVTGSGRGGVWIAGGCAGLAELSTADRISVERADVDEFGDCLAGLARESSGALWAGFPGHLVRIADASSDEPRVWGPDDGLLPRSRVSPIVVTPEGIVWFGHGLGGLGYVRDTALVLYEPGFGLPADEITSMHVDPDGLIWVGQSGTVSRIPTRDGELGEVELLGSEAGVPPGAIRFIHRDHEDRIWIGSYGGGLARCVDDGTRFERITSEQGLPDNSVSGLLEDQMGRFWILGNRGVSMIKRAVLDSVLEGTRSRIDAVIFDSDDGMPEGNGGSPSAYLDPAGIGWFGTIDGLVAIDTKSFPWDSIVPAPMIDNVRFGDDVWTGGDPIIIGGGAREVSIRYSASSTATPGGALYRYRLVGQDQTWVYAVRSGVARYPRVPAGSYTFLLEARNEDGVWSAEPASIQFRILPLWWQTGWFRWGAGTLAATLLAAVLLRRIQNAERRSHRLELAIRERDRAEEVVRRQQRELEHVARIATAGELATSLAHELNQPLMAIVSNAAAGDRLLSNPDFGKDVVREALTEIITEGKRASQVIKELRDFLRRGTVETEWTRVNQLVRDVLLLLGSEIREAGVDVGLDLTGDLPRVNGNRVQLQQVLVNLIMNALDAMRGQEGERRLLIRTRASEAGVEVTIQDTGPGLPEQDRDGLFEAFVTTKSTGMGVGLAISRTLVQAHGGRIEAENHPEGGAVFRFTLPAATGDEGQPELSTAIGTAV